MKLAKLVVFRLGSCDLEASIDNKYTRVKDLIFYHIEGGWTICASTYSYLSMNTNSIYKM